MITTSPFTGGNVVIHTEPDKLMFRQEEYPYTSYEYECVDTHQRFTDTELDWKNLNQVYSQYRAKHDIPSPAEIRTIRERYGLSAAKMSQILGLGANQWRKYEDGEMPAESIGKMLRSIQQPLVFIGYVESCRFKITDEEYGKLCEKIEKAIINEIKEKPRFQWLHEMMGGR